MMMTPPSPLSLRAMQRPLANSVGLGFGALCAAVNLMQIAVATSTATAHQSGLIILLHVSQNPSESGYFSPVELIIPLAVGVVSLFVGALLCMAAAYYAARNTALATGDGGLGRRSGLIAIGIGMIVWLVFSVVVTALTGTDGTIFTVDPYSATSVAQQAVGLAGAVIFRDLALALLAIGPLALFITLGASVGASRWRSQIRQRSYAPVPQGQPFAQG